MNFTKTQEQLFQELEKAKREGISGLYRQLMDAFKEKADIEAVLKQHFVKEEEEDAK